MGVNVVGIQETLVIKLQTYDLVGNRVEPLIQPLSIQYV